MCVTIYYYWRDCFDFYKVTRSYSSHPFLCALAVYMYKLYMLAKSTQFACVDLTHGCGHTHTHVHTHTNTHTHPLWKHYKPVFGAGLSCSQQLINPTSGPSQPKYLCPALYTTLHLSHCMWAVVVVSLPEAVGQQPYLCCRCNSLWILFGVRHCWCFCVKSSV